MQAIQQSDIKVILMIFITCANGMTLFLYCYYGKCANEYSAAFADILYESNWILLSNDLQKTFILMIAHAQKPLSYHGFNIIDLNLETFRKVNFNMPVLGSEIISLFVSKNFLQSIQILKNIILYYLMFKTLATKY